MPYGASRVRRRSCSCKCRSEPVGTEGRKAVCTGSMRRQIEDRWPADDALHRHIGGWYQVRLKVSDTLSTRYTYNRETDRFYVRFHVWSNVISLFRFIWSSLVERLVRRSVAHVSRNAMYYADYVADVFVLPYVFFSTRTSSNGQRILSFGK